ncbi:MAG: Rid family hydrolase [Ferruginibacter sp.]
MKKIQRWPSSGTGRSRAVAFNNIIWIVASSLALSDDFENQVKEIFSLATQSLQQTGSGMGSILSVQVFLSDMIMKDKFDLLWNEWIGKDPDNWPQRTCIEARLAPGLLVEMQLTAAVQ